MASAFFDKLPKEKSMGFDLVQWEGFWYRIPSLKGAIEARSDFEAWDDGILLTSCPKTGSTWLKALIPTIINHTTGGASGCVGGDDDHNDPLVKHHPNHLMPSLELQVFAENSSHCISTMSSPRLFRSHVPYTMLPESIKTSACKMVYIARDTKDVFVSLWHFLGHRMAQTEGAPRLNMDQCFHDFCNGVHPFGPYHNHVLEYWRESMKRPEKILFLRYEDMKQDTRGEVKRLASFLGRPLGSDEEVDKVIWRCSLERLKNLDVNKTGTMAYLRMPNSAYFRRGIVGDWKNSLSMEMGKRLDEITNKYLAGSGLDLTS